MFGTLGGPELLLILVIALIVFGPRKLPEIGKSIGKMMFEFRRASSDFQRTITEEVENEKRSAANELEAAGLPAAADSLAPASPPEGTVASTSATVTPALEPTQKS